MFGWEKKIKNLYQLDFYPNCKTLLVYVLVLRVERVQKNGVIACFNMSLVRCEDLHLAFIK